MTTVVDDKRRAVIPFQPGDVLEIEQQGPDVVVLKRKQDRHFPGSGQPKAESNKRMRFLSEAIQQETDPEKRQALKEQLIEEFYTGDQ